MFGMNIKEIVIGGTAVASLGLGVVNTISNIKTKKRLNKVSIEINDTAIQSAEACNTITENLKAANDIKAKTDATINEVKVNLAKGKEMDKEIDEKIEDLK